MIYQLLALVVTLLTVIQQPNVSPEMRQTGLVLAAQVMEMAKMSPELNQVETKTLNLVNVPTGTSNTVVDAVVSQNEPEIAHNLTISVVFQPLAPGNTKAFYSLEAKYDSLDKVPFEVYASSTMIDAGNTSMRSGFITDDGKVWTYRKNGMAEPDTKFKMVVGSTTKEI